MALVYADTPAQAFNVNADLDQRRVVNYLNSVAANRQAQLQSYGAFAQQAGAEQADQERQQAMMIGLAERAAQQRAQESSRQLEQQKWMDTLGLNKSQLEENIRHNKAIEEKPNASKEALDFKKAQIEGQTKQEDEYATHIAELLEKRRHLQGLLTQIPTDQPGRAAMVENATGEGMQPEPVTFGQGLGNVMTLGILSGHSKQIRKKHAEVKQTIASLVSDLPVDFSKAESIADYAERARKAIDARLIEIPDFKSSSGRTSPRTSTATLFRSCTVESQVRLQLMRFARWRARLPGLTRNLLLPHFPPSCRRQLRPLRRRCRRNPIYPRAARIRLRHCRPR